MKALHFHAVSWLIAGVLVTGVALLAACETNPVRDPVPTHLQLWQPGDRYYYGAYAVTDALADVEDVTPNADSWYSGDAGMVYTFAYENISGQDATFVLHVDLPEPYVLDVEAGDQLWVTARTEELWIRESTAELTDLDGNLLLEYYTGPLREERHALEELPRQSAPLGCGKVTYPRLSYPLWGPLLTPPTEVSLYQGDILELDTDAGPYAVILARAAISSAEACDDETGIEEVAILRRAQ